MTTYLRFVLLALATFAQHAHAFELNGSIRSSTGTLPSAIKVTTVGADKQPVIAGNVEDGHYRIDLPDAGMVLLRVEAPGWDAEPKVIFDPKTAGALDFLVYPAEVPEPAIAAELIRMGEQDQKIREHIPAKPDPEFYKRWQAEDKQREDRLAQIIAEKGWPMISQVGHEAASSAWLIAQHATPAFLKRCLPLMQAAAEKMEIRPGHLALSIDRVRMQDHEKQVYGSQFQPGPDGKPSVYPVEDPEHLNQRRYSMGLESFEAYRKHFEN